MPGKTPNKPRMFDLHWRISALFVAFGILLALGVSVSVGFGQVMITHPVWEQILRSTTQHYIAGSTRNQPLPLPTKKSGTLSSIEAVASTTVPPAR